MTLPSIAPRRGVRLARSWAFSILGRIGGFVLLLTSVRLLSVDGFARFSILYAAAGFTAFTLFTFEQSNRFAHEDGQHKQWLIWPGVAAGIVAVGAVAVAAGSTTSTLAIAAVTAVQVFSTRARIRLHYEGEQHALFLSRLVRDCAIAIGIIALPALRNEVGVSSLLVLSTFGEFLLLSHRANVVSAEHTTQRTNASRSLKDDDSLITMLASMAVGLTPLALRAMILWYFGDMVFTAYEVTDRFAYITFTLILGGMSTEAQRKWSLQVAAGANDRVVRESAVAIASLSGLVLMYGIIVRTPLGRMVLELLAGDQVDIDRVVALSPALAASSASYAMAFLMSRALVALRHERLSSLILGVGACVAIAAGVFASTVLESITAAALAGTIGFGSATMLGAFLTYRAARSNTALLPCETASGLQSR